MARVSTVIPAYNAARFVERTLRSVYAQTSPIAEVIVVDDESRDDTAAIVEQIARGAPVPTTLLRQPNAGPAAARNRGTRAAKGDLVAYVDADDEWLPEKLERQVESLAANPSAVLCCTGVITIDVDGKETGVGATATDTTFEALLDRNFVVNSSVVVRRSALGDAPFNTRRDFIASEDYDLWLRLARRAPISYLPEPLVRYRVHPEGISRAGRRGHDSERAVIEALFAALEREGTLDPVYRRRRLAQISFECGDSLFYAGDRAAARGEFLRAFQGDERRIGALGMAIATLVPPVTLNAVRAVARVVRDRPARWRSWRKAQGRGVSA